MNSSPTVQFRPLGGLGEIGMNCFALRQQGQILLVDCGAAFPDDDLGVDLLIPKFDWLLEHQEEIQALVITHGHEDHIGAVPFLLKRLSRDIPIFAPPHATELLRERLARHRLSDECLRPLQERTTHELGSFSVEPVAVAHSIIDAYALAIGTCAGTIIHTADFDLDEEQPAGHLTDSHRFSELGQGGVRLLLSDSTNIDRAERPGNEGEVSRALRVLIEKKAARVVLAMFSSNVHRLKGVAEAAVATGRKLCFLGQSLRRHYEIATKLGYLDFPSGLIVAPEQLASLPASEVLILAGGSQGEGASSLRRLSRGKHSAVRLESGDCVVLSSRVIPGNERKVFSMRCDFLRGGIQVEDVHSAPGIHVSGHASRSELGKMLEWTCPRGFIPVHGTLHHLTKHEALARDYLVEDTAVVEDGAVVEVPRDGPMRVIERASSSPTRIAFGGKELLADERKERGDLARTGCAFVSLVVDVRRDLVGRAQVDLVGIPGLKESGMLRRIEDVAAIAARDHMEARMISMEVAVKRAVRGAIFEATGVRSVVVVQVHQAA